MSVNYFRAYRRFERMFPGINGRPGEPPDDRKGADDIARYPRTRARRGYTPDAVVIATITFDPVNREVIIKRVDE
jgi:hypothetical protein